MGPILALDLGVRLGFAVGAPGSGAPRSGAVILKQDDQYRSVGFFNLRNWLEQEILTSRPELIIKEQRLPLAGFKRNANSEATVWVTAGFHASVEEISWRFQIKLARDVHPATVRKHFIGIGRVGTREETKRAVIKRSRLLKLVPPDCCDDDRCDAIATWHYAQAVYGRAVPNNLYLFGEAAS